MLRNRIFGLLMPVVALVLSLVPNGLVVAVTEFGHDTLKNLIAALETEKDDGKRLQLIKQLAVLKSPKAIATLSLAMAEEKNTSAMRIEALKGLEALEHADAHDAIAIAAFKSDSAVVRARAIEAIGNLRIRDFIPACVRGLASMEPVVRRSAIDALIQFNDLRSASQALPFVKDTDDAVRKSAGVGIGLFTIKLSLFILHRG